MDAAIRDVLTETGPPGVAVAVVDRSGVLHAASFGLRDLGTGEPMTTLTRYPIASTTKSMNATFLAMLVEDGLLDWDRPVRNDLPGFELVDTDAAARATLRDLVSLRTGLPRHDWVWGTEGVADRTELMRRVRHLTPIARLRERFLYNNITATLAGHVAEVATGRPWEVLVTERLLVPLEMHATVVSRPHDVTRAYAPSDGGELAPSIIMSGAVTAPAGGVLHSHVEDMARWVCFNLGDGETGRGRLLSAEAFGELRNPLALLGPFGGDGYYSPRAAYALGWFVDDFRGRSRVSHDGHFNDVDSSVMTLPDDGLGVVCFTNAGAFGLARPIAEHALAVALGVEPGDALRDRPAAYRRGRQARRDALAAAPRVSGTAPSHDLAELLGRYDHPGYGELEVRSDAGRPVLAFGALDIPLEHWHYDAWIATDVDRIGAHEHPFDGIHQVVFGTGGDGAVDSVAIRFEPLTEPIRFTTRPT